jgi:hypothetical protein
VHQLTKTQLSHLQAVSKASLSISLNETHTHTHTHTSTNHKQTIKNFINQPSILWVRSHGNCMRCELQYHHQMELVKYTQSVLDLHLVSNRRHSYQVCELSHSHVKVCSLGSNNIIIQDMNVCCPHVINKTCQSSGPKLIFTMLTQLKCWAIKVKYHFVF